MKLSFLTSLIYNEIAPSTWKPVAHELIYYQHQTGITNQSIAYGIATNIKALLNTLADNEVIVIDQVTIIGFAGMVPVFYTPLAKVNATGDFAIGLITTITTANNFSFRGATIHTSALGNNFVFVQSFVSNSSQFTNYSSNTASGTNSSYVYTKYRVD